MRRAAALGAGAACLLNFMPLAAAEPIIHLTGVVRTAQPEAERIVLRLGTATTTVTAHAPLGGINAHDLVDSAVRLSGIWKGISAGPRDPMRQVFDITSIEIVERGPRDPFDRPEISVREILRLGTTELPLHRVKIAGTVTAQFGRQSVYLTDGSDDLRVRMLDTASLRPGDVIEAAGYISRAFSPRVLVDAVLRKIDSRPAPAPTRVGTARVLSTDDHNTLVQTEATLLRQSVDANDVVLVLLSDGLTFEASAAGLEEGSRFAALVPGSRLDVTGIAEVRSRSNEPLSVRIRLRDANDVRVVALPTWWTAQRALYLLGVVIVGFVGTGGWIVALRRRLPVVERARERAEAALRERDAQLQQAQKMEAIGRLAGGVAHDFNNLLMAISGYSDLAREESADRPQVVDYIDQVRKAAGTGAGLTRQLLAFSRKQVFEPAVLDLNVVVADMDKMLRRLLGEDVCLVLSTAETPLHVKADRAQLEQVLVNLAVNARDAMPNGGTLEVHTQSQTASAILIVSDNGTGMDEHTMSHLFEPFFTTKAPGQGTGLGLAMVYGAVAQSGGTISVKSVPHEGATFVITMPRVDDPVDTLPLDEEAGSVPGSETVLLVEDDAGVRTLAQCMLEREGYVVLVAAHGREAMRVAESHQGRVDLLLTDVVMPEMSGIDLAQLLAVSRPDTRVLFMSGYADHPALKRQPLPVRASVLQKPFTRTTVALAVRQALTLRQPDLSTLDGAACRS
jgi:signal transduction histidine kinase/ActR/RegA family two-component response regulator